MSQLQTKHFFAINLCIYLKVGGRKYLQDACNETAPNLAAGDLTCHGELQLIFLQSISSVFCHRTDPTKQFEHVRREHPPKSFKFGLIQNQNTFSKMNVLTVQKNYFFNPRPAYSTGSLLYFSSGVTQFQNCN